MRHVATISTAATYIRIFGFYGDFLNRVVQPFCRNNLYKWAKKPQPGGAKAKWEVTHVFARSNYDKTEYRIPGSLLKEFLEFARRQGYNPARILILHEPILKGIPVDLKLKAGFENPRDYQEDWIEYKLGEGQLKINGENTGAGKAQTLSSKIKIPGGWTTMGEIKEGDLVIGKDGLPTKVLGVYPQGVTKVWRVHFVDGRYTDVNPDHLWSIFDHPKRSWKTMSTTAIREGLKSQPKRFHVPLCDPEDQPAKEFKIHPYVMGVLLGDGGTTNGNVTINKPSQQLFDKIDSLLPENLECRWRNDVTFVIVFKEYDRASGAWHVRDDLKTYELMGKKSHLKHIPEEYLHGSRQQRLELLQGLMDTDGTIDKHGSASFSSSSLALSEGVQYLVRSLGGIARLSPRTSKYPYKGEIKEGLVDNRIHIRYSRPEELFTIEHKQERSVKGQYTDTLKLCIDRIEELPDEATQCIMVEAEDSLYVTDDFIVTHNTFMTLFALVKLGMRAVITIQPRFIVTWLNDIAKTLDVEQEDVLVWENSDLELLASNLEKGLINPKIIILPVSRISTWLKACKEDQDKAELDEIYKRMGVGVRVYDEVHESFHEVTMSLMYGNFAKTIVLSATLKSDDPMLNNMYQIVLPKECRLKDPGGEHYIDIVAMLYQIDVRKHKPKTMQAGSYNDLVFEKWILDHPVAFEHYFNMAKEMYEEFYLPIKESGTKCLFFFSRVEMCLRMVEEFRKAYPGEDFDSYLGTLDKKTPRKYLEHEVLFTTPSSCGTGKDIPGLVRVFSFPTIKSQQKGKQMIGRLRDLMRKMEFEGRIDPLYCFACCVDIPQQRDCYDKRLVDFEPKQKSWKKRSSQYALN